MKNEEIIEENEIIMKNAWDKRTGGKDLTVYYRCPETRKFVGIPYVRYNPEVKVTWGDLRGKIRAGYFTCVVEEGNFRYEDLSYQLTEYKRMKFAPLMQHDVRTTRQERWW